MKWNGASVVKYAAASRILMFFIQVGFTYLGERYDTSSLQQNILSRGSQNATVNKMAFSNGTTIDQLIQSSFHGYINWDAAYFLSIALHGYEYEQMLAFFPLFPITVSLVKRLLNIVTLGILSDLSAMILAAALINTLSFSFAALFLYKLTLLLKKDIMFADITVMLFCFNPANVFFSAFYSESLYVFLQFAGMYMINQDNQTNLKYVLAGTIFAGGSATRSNGVISIGFLIYSYLTESCYLARNFKGKQRNLQYFSKIVTKTVVLAFSVSLMVLPFVLFQYFAFTTYCIGESSVKEKGHWCHKTFPLSYSYVQRYYWNVGPFMYFEIKQIPNFVLALPVILLAYAATAVYFKSASKDALAFLKDIVQDQNVTQSRKSKVTSAMMMNPRLLPFVVHLFFLVTFGIINIHIQVLTRMLFSSSPVLLWFCADQLCSSESKHKSAWIKQYLILGYFISYTLIGCLLHCNFLPWT